MRFLLDTHALLWAEMAPETLSEAARTALSAPGAELLVSAVSALEIAIKWKLGRLKLPLPPGEFLRTRLARSRIAALPVSVEHAAHVASLPLLHNDPFDRLLVAQAQLEGLILITRDEWIPRYDVAVMVA